LAAEALNKLETKAESAAESAIIRKPLSVPLLPLPPLLCSSCCPCCTQGFERGGEGHQHYGCTVYMQYTRAREWSYISL
jgi:hypothetical protein